jgi:hypothetical protein
VLVRKPSAGKWTLTPKDGSPSIEKIYQRYGLPQPKIEAKVVRVGKGYELIYKTQAVKGQKVTFAEEGPATGRTLGAAKPGAAHASAVRGRLAFRPGAGPGGKRRITAIVTQDGVPRATIPLSNYQAPKPPKVTRPLIAGKPHGTKLIVKWTRSAAAVRYRVEVTASDGRVFARTMPAATRALTMAHFLPTTSATIKVTPFAADGRRGKAALLKVARRAKSRALVL